MRIVLIEDDNHYRELLTSFLESKGHEVFAVSDPSGFQACCQVDVACTHKDTCGDILLIDQNMPNMTGLEFIQRQIIRGCQGSLRNPMLMSANLTRTEKELATRLGCPILNKPFRLSSLIAWVESVEAHLPSESQPKGVPTNIHQGVTQ